MCCRESTTRLELFTASAGLPVEHRSLGFTDRPSLTFINNNVIHWLKSFYLMLLSTISQDFCLKLALLHLRKKCITLTYQKGDCVFQQSLTNFKKKKSVLSMQSDSCFLERQWDLNSSSFFERIKVQLVSSRINFTKSMWKDIYFLCNSSKIHKHM